MQTERDSKCVAKNVDRLSDEVVVGTQIEPARASYQVGHHFFIQQGAPHWIKKWWIWQTGVA